MTKVQPMKYVSSYLTSNHTIGRVGGRALGYFVGKKCIMSLPAHLQDGGDIPSPFECASILRGNSVESSPGWYGLIDAAVAPSMNAAQVLMGQVIESLCDAQVNFMIDEKRATDVSARVDFENSGSTIAYVYDALTAEGWVLCGDGVWTSASTGYTAIVTELPGCVRLMIVTH